MKAWLFLEKKMQNNKSKKSGLYNSLFIVIYRNMKGRATILWGLIGSGKTWYTKDFDDKEDVVIFNLNEELFKKFGKHFAPEKYQEHEKEKEEYRHFAEENGSDFELVYFAIPAETLKKRLSQRNINETESNHVISFEMLNDFIEQFESLKDYENATQYNWVLTSR